jgi:hypothetical protein
MLRSGSAWAAAAAALLNCETHDARNSPGIPFAGIPFASVHRARQQKVVPHLRPSATRRDGAKQQLEGQAVPAADALCSAAGLRLLTTHEESRRRRELCVSRCGSSNEGSTGFLDGGESVVCGEPGSPAIREPSMADT